MARKKRNEDIIPTVSVETVLRLEALPWAKACAVEITALWNELFPELNHELTLQGFDASERELILSGAKQNLLLHRERVLAKWTRPYVEALLGTQEKAVKVSPPSSSAVAAP